MSGILQVVPVGKRCVFRYKLCHDSQEAARLEKGPESIQFETRMMKMLDHFGGRNEIVGLA